MVTSATQTTPSQDTCSDCHIITCFCNPIAHSKPVRGVAVDALNMEVFSGSSDSTIKVATSHTLCKVEQGYKELNEKHNRKSNFKISAAPLFSDFLAQYYTCSDQSVRIGLKVDFTYILNSPPGL